MIAHARLTLTAGLIGAAVAGCSTAVDVKPSSALEARLLTRIPAAEAAAENGSSLLHKGMRHLVVGNLKEASKQFNLGLRYAPQDANLHFLNGLTYDLLSAGGDRDQAQLAEVGYELALTFDPNHWVAAYRLGRLHFRKGNHAAALQRFSEAVLIEPDRPNLLYGLAVASYYARDPATADAVLGRLPPEYDAVPVVVRARAMVAAALNRQDEARRHAGTFVRVSGDPRQATSLTRRIAQWREFHDRLDRDGPRRLAEVAQPEDRKTPETVPARPVAPVPQRTLPPPRLDDETAPSRPTGAAPAAPAVPGERPENKEMVVIDVIIIRQEEARSVARGVNLLDGLQLTFQGSIIDWARDKTTDYTGFVGTNERQTNRSYTVSFPAVSYSLNIANSTDTFSKILARPTIVVHDREEAAFFLGSELTYTTLGDRGSSFDKDVGVEVRLRPEYQEDGRVRVKVDAKFDAFTTTTAGSFSEAVQTQKNEIKTVAIMAMGETMILGGGTQRQEEESETGVPVLRDLPLIQYAFSRETKTAIDRSVLILLTPRTPASVRTENAVEDLHRRLPEGSRFAPEALAELKNRYRFWFHPSSNLVGEMIHLSTTKLYREFRSGDILLEDIHYKPGDDLHHAGRKPSILQDAIDFIYY